MNPMTNPGNQQETIQGCRMLHHLEDCTRTTKKIKDCLRGPAGILTRNQDLLRGTEDWMKNQPDLLTRGDQMKSTWLQDLLVTITAIERRDCQTHSKQFLKVPKQQDQLIKKK